MLFPLRGEEAAGAHLFLRKVESGHNTKQSETGVQNEVGRDFMKIFLNFEFRVVDGDVGDNSTESWALVITLGLVVVLSFTALGLALVTLIRTNREDNKSRVMTSTTDNNML